MQINVTDLRCDIVPTYLDAKTEPEKAHKCLDIFLRSLNGLLGKYKRIGVFLVPWHLKQTAYIDMIHEDAFLIFDLGWKDPTALFLQPLLRRFQQGVIQSQCLRRSEKGSRCSTVPDSKPLFL